MHQPKLLIIGEARHGKDELMQYLAKNYGYLGWSSSYFAACHFMVEKMRERTGIIYDSVEACYADRQSPEHRQIWFESIEEFNDPDRTKMAREMLAQPKNFMLTRRQTRLISSSILMQKSDLSVKANTSPTQRLKFQSQKRMLCFTTMAR